MAQSRFRLIGGNDPPNAPHHRAAAKRPDLKERRGRRLRVPVVVMQTFELQYERRRKVWQFPQERFVQYAASDETWCRFFGIGKEVEVVESVTIPNAYVRSVSPDGSIEFGAIAEPVVTEVCSA